MPEHCGVTSTHADGADEPASASPVLASMSFRLCEEDQSMSWSA